jgi:MerR family transcriptional regulator/heat shock protein HspR
MAERARRRRSDDRGLYIISVAAELAGVHPQTLRIYERKGLLQPSRTSGNTRRYSERDIARLQSIQRLTQDHGVNLAGVKMIVEMEAELERMRSRMEQMAAELERARRSMAERAIRVERTAMVPLSSVPRFPWQGRP